MIDAVVADGGGLLQSHGSILIHLQGIEIVQHVVDERRCANMRVQARRFVAKRGPLRPQAIEQLTVSGGRQKAKLLALLP